MLFFVLNFPHHLITFSVVKLHYIALPLMAILQFANSSFVREPKSTQKPQGTDPNFFWFFCTETLFCFVSNFSMFSLLFQWSDSITSLCQLWPFGNVQSSRFVESRLGCKRQVRPLPVLLAVFIESKSPARLQWWRYCPQKGHGTQ